MKVPEHLWNNVFVCLAPHLVSSDTSTSAEHFKYTCIDNNLHEFATWRSKVSQFQSAFSLEVYVDSEIEIIQ